MTTGTLFIISAPSGAGKTSLVKQLLSSRSDMAVSISHTTRAARPGERHGHDYYFVTHEQFEAMIAESEFLEYAKVYENYYGTAKLTVDKLLQEGCDVILEIDWQGARQVRQLFPAGISIFILPPSRTALQQRLQNRGQDDATTIAKRMQTATSEMMHHDEYDYIVVNDDFECALQQLHCIVESASLTRSRQCQRLQGLLAELLAPDIAMPASL